MKSKAIFMALLALAFGAQAVPVDVEKAKLAARAWAYRGATLGARIGDTVEDAATHRTANDVAFYAIKMKGGGTVFMSSDTEVEPVICFTSDPDAGVALDPKSPLWALLNADLAVRGKTTVAPAMAANGAVTQSRTAKLWADLIREGGPDYIRPSFAAPITEQRKIGDLRVAPLVQSQWSQSTANSKACWNYYTPPGPDGSTGNAVCGCVATAMSQVMRYHKFPNDTVEQVTHTCTYNGNPISLTTQAGTYDWDSMTLTPNKSGSSMTAENYQAIGKLTSDAGITVFMAYTDGESGAFGFDITYALTHHWHYKNSVFFDVRDIQPQESGNENRDKAFQKALFANFDAGYPVCMGVPGHAIVADGYGYNEGLDYVHLNMGWAGQSDYWYNLPDVTKAHPAFTAVEDISYNIFPDKDKTYGIISGRLIEAETGSPCVDAEVTLKKNGSSDEVKVRTTATGVYGAAVKAGTYVISAVSSDGSKAGTLSGDVTVKAPTTSLVNWNGLGRLTPSVREVTDLGNSWGNDFTVEDVVYDGSVRNVTQGGALYGTLDAALNAAHADDEIEILSETLLRYPQAVTKNVSIRTATGVDPAVAVVHCRAAAVHGFTNVLNGVTLALENVVFGNTQGCFVHVSSNAFLSVSGTIGLTDGSYVHTEDERGIKLAGELASYLTVDCLVSTGLGQQFGTCSDEAFAASAANFMNPYDEELGGEVSGGKLVWSRVPVDPALAIAYFTGDAGENKQYYRKLGTLFADHGDKAGDIVILKDCELKAPAVALAGAKRLVCTNESGAATITFSANAGATFYVEAGASLSVSNLVFTGATGDGAFVVKGGELTLDDGTRITDCGDPEAGFVDGETFSCAVTVRFDDDWATAGKLTMLEGSVISNCTTVGSGGGVYVGGGWGDQTCGLDLFGGQVVNCSAGLYGGGVYAAVGSDIRIKGASTVDGCVSDADGFADNLCISWWVDLELADELTGRVGVKALGGFSDNEDVFGYIAEACSAAAATNSAVCFWNDQEPELHGAVGEDSDGNRVLVWSDEPVQKDVPPLEYWVARVIYTNDVPFVTNEFATVDEALGSVKADAIVEINDVGYPLEDGSYYFESEEDLNLLTNSVPYLRRNATIRHNVTIRTMSGDGSFTNGICRAADVTITVASGGCLTLSDIALLGSYPTIEFVGEDAGEWVFSVSWDYGGSTTMIAVEPGGELVMEDGSCIVDVRGSASRDAVAVSVDRARFTMKDGSSITNCFCTFKDSDDPTKAQAAPAGGVIVEGVGARFDLVGGEISSCAGVLGGGAYVGSGAEIYVSGASEIVDNFLLKGATPSTTNANLSVGNEAASSDAERGHLYLAGEFTGAVGILEPRLYREDQVVGVDTNVFGSVLKEAGELPALLPSAAKFTRDVTGATGLIVTNDTDSLLVWSSAVKDGVYTDENGNEYRVVNDQPVPPPAPTEIDPPTAVTGLIYNGNEQTGVVASVGFTLTGNVAINAGDYTATVMLKDGYVWTGGSTDPQQIDWTIAKATYDMSGVTFDDMSVEADGSPKSILVQGQLPAGVTVDYEGNGQTEPGSYTITAKFTGDAVNYEPIDDMTATLTITKKQDPDPPDPPQWDVITNHPTPIAFQSIDRVSDTEWKLVVTNRVEYCNYRLIWTTDLTKGFTSTGAWEHAVGPAASPTWTTNVLTTGGAWFWRAEGADGTNMVPHVEN